MDKEDVVYICSGILSSVQSLSCAWLFGTPWTEARQASLSIINSWSLLKFMSIESVMPSAISSSVVPFSRLQSFPASGSFLTSQLLASSGQSIGASAPASVLPVNVQAWFPLALTDILDYIQFNFFLWLTFVLCILFLEVHCRDVSFWR